MADTDDKEEQKDSEDKSSDKEEQKDSEDQSGDTEEQKDSEDQSSDKKASGGGILLWIILAVVIALCAGAGFGLSRLLAGSRTPATGAEPTQQDESAQAKDLKADAPDLSGGDSRKSWYYSLESVVANLNEPGVTRYVRATITLEINPEVDEKKGTAFLEEKNPLLTNWLTIYLAGLGLEDIRGDRNLKRVQSQILDAFNEKLFPDAKPQIKHILFKEFAIQ